LEAGEIAYGPQIVGGNIGSVEFAQDLARASHNIQFAAFDMKNGMFDMARLQTSLLGLLDRADILKRGTVQQNVPAFARVPLRPHLEPSFVIGEMLDIGLTGAFIERAEARMPLLDTIARLKTLQNCLNAFCLLTHGNRAASCLRENHSQNSSHTVEFPSSSAQVSLTKSIAS
jgi:hypothetical protein